MLLVLMPSDYLVKINTLGFDSSTGKKQQTEMFKPSLQKNSLELELNLIVGKLTLFTILPPSAGKRRVLIHTLSPKLLRLSKKWSLPT